MSPQHARPQEGLSTRAVSPVVASLLLILVAIAASYLVYSVLITHQTTAKQASGPPTLIPEISIEGVNLTNYSVILFIRVERAPATIDSAFLYDINNTLSARLFTLTPLKLAPGTVTPVELYSDTEILPGHYKVSLIAAQGAVAEKYFKTPIATGKTTVLYNLTTAYTSDANSLNTSDSIAIYKAWVDALTSMVYWNVSIHTTITYLRAALYNESGSNLISGVGGNPYVNTTTILAPNYIYNYWTPVQASWQPFVVVFTVKTQ